MNDDLRLDESNTEDIWLEAADDRKVLLGTVITKDGDRELVAFVSDAPRGTKLARCIDCPPEHEKTGPLPRSVKRALWGDCQATATSTRRPCRNLAGPTGYCASHRQQQEAKT